MDSLKGTLTPMRVLTGTLNGGIAYGTFNYNELENKPSVNGTELVGNVTIDIPTKTSDLTNDSGFITDADLPTKTSELTNDSGFITDADVPTTTSELTNDSGFITSEDIPTIPTATSQLTNDSGFLTMNTTPVRSVNSQTGDVNLFIPNATSQLTNDAGFITDNDIPVQSVNGQTGAVELTAEDLSYDGGTETVWDKVESKSGYIDESATNIHLWTFPSSTSQSWVATDDCIIVGTLLSGANSSAYVNIGSITCGYAYSAGSNSVGTGVCIPVKKGQTVTVGRGDTGSLVYAMPLK